MSAGQSSLIGRVLDDRYRVIEEIGRGGHGTVYRGVHLQLERDVAIKVIGLPSPGVERRFKREAKAQARLRHPAVVKLLDFGHDHEGNPYMVQEFVDGESLRERIKHGPPPTDETVVLIGDVLDALAEAHALGLVHRDVKPANIMVARGPRRIEARLLDFGVVKLIDPDSHTRLTRAGVVVGTPGYMAPEQVSLEPVTPATDVYSTGVVLYQMLSGQRPYSGTLKEVLRAQLHSDPPPLPAHVPPALARVVATAMARSTAQRYPSADAMNAALKAAFTGGLPPPIPPFRPPARAAGPPSGPRATAMLTPAPASPTPMLSASHHTPGLLLPPTAAPMTPLPPPPAPTLPTGARVRAPAVDRRASQSLPTAERRRAPVGLIAILALALAIITAGLTLWVSRAPDAIDGPVYRLRAGSSPTARPTAPPAPPLANPFDAVEVTTPAVIEEGVGIVDAEPSDQPDAAAAPEPAPRRVRRTRKRRPDAPSRPAPAVVEPAPDDRATADRAPDAARPDPRAARLERLEGGIDAAFADCRCDAALGLVDDLARLDPASARLRRSQHRRRCRLALPGNCVTAGRQ